MDQIVNLYTFLLHAVAVTHRYATVGLTVEVIGNAERRTDFILPAVPLADGPRVVVIHHKVLGQF